jgi:DNA-binding NarL/FixJ family response regulator
VESVPLVRDGLAGWLRAAGLDVAGTAHDGPGALRDLAVLDIELVVLGPNVRAADDLCRLVSVQEPAPRCLTVVPPGGSEGVYGALRTRTAYVFGDVDFAGFRAALASAMDGVPAPRTSLSIVEQPASPHDTALLALLADGLSNREIAAEMGMSVSWVKARVSRLMSRLSARGRTELVARAMRDGMVGTTAGAGSHTGDRHGVQKGSHA